MILTLLFLLQYPGLILNEVIGSSDLAMYYYPWSTAMPVDYPTRSYSSFSDFMDQGFPPMVYLQNAIVGGNIPFYTNYYQNGVI
jgi:hypothetical protein